MNPSYNIINMFIHKNHYMNHYIKPYESKKIFTDMSKKALLPLLDFYLMFAHVTFISTEIACHLSCLPYCHPSNWDAMFQRIKSLQFSD